MRKLLSVLLVVLMLVTAIACDPESGTGNDVKFDVIVNLKHVGADNKKSVAYVGDATWKYTAVKGDDGYTTGETTEEKELGKLNLSLGSWTITVNCYDNDNKLIYTGSVKTGSITSNGSIEIEIKATTDEETGLTFYSSLHDAILEVESGKTIVLLCDAEGSGLEIKDASGNNGRDSLTIDFNGHTYTMTNTGVGSAGYPTQAMHWGDSVESLTLKNGAFKVAEGVENPKGQKKFNMAMQSYLKLTVENMEFDFTNIPVDKYDDRYTQEYQQKEKPMFNCYADSKFIDCTITMPAESTKGMTIGTDKAQTTGANVEFENTTLNGYANFETNKGSLIVDFSSKITKGVVSYFDSTETKTYTVESVTKDGKTTYTLTITTNGQG